MPFRNVSHPSLRCRCRSSHARGPLEHIIYSSTLRKTSVGIFLKNTSYTSANAFARFAYKTLSENSRTQLSPPNHNSSSVVDIAQQYNVTYTLEFDMLLFEILNGLILISSSCTLTYNYCLRRRRNLHRRYDTLIIRQSLDIVTLKA